MKFNKLTTFFTIKVLLLLLIITTSPIGFVQLKNYISASSAKEKRQKERQEANERAKKLAELKDWGNIVSRKMEKKIILKTKYSDGKMFYQLIANKEAIVTIDKKAGLIIKFKDKDGFDIYRLDIDARGYSFEDDENKVKIKAEYNGSVELPSTLYENFASIWLGVHEKDL